MMDFSESIAALQALIQVLKIQSSSFKMQNSSFLIKKTNKFIIFVQGTDTSTLKGSIVGVRIAI